MTNDPGQIKISSHHLEMIRHHAETDYPHECCGLLLGHIVADRKEVVKAIATQNSWDASEAAAFAEATGQPPRDGEQNSNFSIAPAEMLRVQKQARVENLDIVGIYHSHPDREAKPSEFDCAIAWPIYSYLIVSVVQGKAETILSWVLDEEGQFQAENIVIYNG
ncbi:MAG: M67 family metallopeptidase [Spirulinaceae cyanobacterium]